MILANTEILGAIERKEIEITRFDRDALNPNSYDVRLARRLLTPLARVFNRGDRGPCIDMGAETKWNELLIPPDGLWLYPEFFYLGVTQEHTFTPKHLPNIDGKSGVGRNALSIHETAGRGDVFFRGHWTLEITCSIPVKVYPNQPIGQITFSEVKGEVDPPYSKTGSYGDEFSNDPHPQPSKLWKKIQAERSKCLSDHLGPCLVYDGTRICPCECRGCKKAWFEAHRPIIQNGKVFYDNDRSNP